MAALSIDRLRRQALAATLSAPSTLAHAIDALGFVQADPIRSPARAQDLILRHRVANYRAGDLERRFAKLRLEEDYLYAYGFMPGETATLLHPRVDAAAANGRHEPDGLAAEVLAFVREHGETHPQDLQTRFGGERAVNGWGGFSKATTRALQALHYYGLLRVARRRDGIRIYQAARKHGGALSSDERLRRLLLLVVNILAPISKPSLRATFALLKRGAPGLGPLDPALRSLLSAGAIQCGQVDGETYLWPTHWDATNDSPHRKVRFLAPFDPIVWDRRRFERLWGWEYRFEAYTPIEKRRFGYYAMPLLWGEKMLGCVNLSMADAKLDIQTIFVGREPKGRDFRRAMDAEIARIEAFLAKSAEQQGGAPLGAADDA
jgi:uncharacterized protein